MAIRTYDILLDSYNSTIPEPIVGRQGDKNGAVTLHVTITDRGSAVNLTGQTINLIAETAQGTAVVADNAGVTLTDATNGRFDYAIPNALWSESGKIKRAYFSLNDADGQQTTYDLIFIVKKAIDIDQKHADDYVTIIDGTLRDLQSKVNAIYEAYNQGDFYNKSETDNKDAATLSSAKAYTHNSLSGIVALPETFTNLAAIKAKYPNGSNGIMVAADNGHKYIWANGAWTDAGIYQSVGIADNSIAPKYLTARAAPAFLAQDGSNQAVYERSKNTLHLNDSLVISKGEAYSVRGDVVLGQFGFIVFDQTAKNVAFVTGGGINDSMAILGTIYNGNLMLPGVNINDKNDISPIIWIDQNGDLNKFTFDFNSMKIEYPEGSIYYGQKRYSWSQGSIDIPTTNDADQYLILVPSTGKFRLSGASIEPSYSLPDEVVLGYIETSRKRFYSTKIDASLCKTIPENKDLINRQQTFAYSTIPVKIDFDNKTAWLPLFVMNDQRAETVTIDPKTVQLDYYGGWLTYDKSNKSYQFDQGATPTRFGSDILLMGWIDCGQHNTLGVWGNNWVDVTLGSSRIGASLYYLGDSITVGFKNSDEATACYPNRIYQRTRVPYTSDAISGTTVCGTESSSFVSRFKASDMVGKDKLIIFGGHNDFHISKPLGTIESQDTTEFYGAYQAIIKSALANNPALRIYLIAPNWRIVDEASGNADNRYEIATFKNNAGFTFLDYIQAIKNIGDKYHLPVLNLYEDWGVYQGNHTAWLVDGLHPNVSGQRWLSNIIQGFIENN